MKKTLLIFASLITIMCSAYAQTPETPVVTNDTPYAGYTKTSVFVQYGFAPISCFKGWTGDLFTPLKSYKPEVDNQSMGLGAITVGVTININKLIEVSIPLTYARNTGNYKKEYPLNINSDYTDNWFSLTPNVKFNWYNSNSGNLMLYSRAGLGIATGNRNVPDTNTGSHFDSKVQFAFILSPIGIEVGKNIAFFAEAGIGQTGTVSMGLRFRFRKTERSFNADGTVKHHNWYDRYLDKE